MEILFPVHPVHKTQKSVLSGAEDADSAEGANKKVPYLLEFEAYLACNQGLAKNRWVESPPLRHSFNFCYLQYVTTKFHSFASGAVIKIRRQDGSHTLSPSRQKAKPGATPTDFCNAFPLNFTTLQDQSTDFRIPSLGAFQETYEEQTAFKPDHRHSCIYLHLAGPNR